MPLDESERPSKSINKFESMLKTDDVYFFDGEDFEDIIHHYLNIGKISLAKKGVKLGLEQHPHSIELKLLNVEILVFENKLDEAENLLNELQTIDCTNDEIYIQRASIFSKNDNHEAAIEMLNKAQELSDNNFDVHSLLGMEYLFLDNYEMAKSNFIKCIDIDEHDYASLYNLIYCFEFTEDFDGAIIYLNNYLERNPYCEVAWHQLGKIYLEKDMAKEALTAFDFAIISDDSFIGAYFEKGRVLEKMGKYNEAIENYTATISIEDPTSHAFLRIGKCHEKLGNMDLAEKFYYKTVHVDPQLDKGWLAFTKFYLKQGEFNQALKNINKAININGENPLYWKKSAEIFTALKNYDEADFAYKQVVELGNYDLNTWINWAEVVSINNDHKSAIQILLQGKEFYPESAQLHYKIAKAYILDNDLTEGWKNLAIAYQITPEKLDEFHENFPQYNREDLLSNIITFTKK